MTDTEEQMIRDIRDRLIRIEERQSANTERIERIEGELEKLRGAWLKLAAFIVGAGGIAGGTAHKLTELIS